MATNEEYLDNLLKAFEEEEKAREKEVRIAKEKTIITDDDTYQNILDEVDDILKNDIEDAAPVDDIADLMSMLGNDTFSEEMPSEEKAFEVTDLELLAEADTHDMLQENVDKEENTTDIFSEEVPADDIADLMSILNANMTSEEMPIENNIKFDEDNNREEIESLLNSSEDELLKMLQEDNIEVTDIDGNNTADDTNSENEWASDLDALLANAVDHFDENQDLFGESSSNESTSKDVDITQLIDGLDITDESLSEISELLKKSDNNEMVIPFEENEQDNAIRELTQSEPEKNKNGFRKKEKKSKKDKKEPRALGQFFKTLLEDEEELPEEESAKAINENDDLLAQLDEENKKNKKKKEKKKKEKKKDKKSKKEEGNLDNASDGADGDEESNGKKKKKKREKKQKLKENDGPLPKEKSKKVLSRKAFMVLIAFCASLIAIIVCLSTFIPDYTEKKQARNAFYQGNYEEAYVLLYGKSLNDADQLIYNRISVVLQLERKIEAFYFEDEAGRNAEALDALMQGVSYYHTLSDKNIFGAGDELKLSYQKILDILNQKYGVDEDKALEVIAEDDIRYSKWIYSVAEDMQFETIPDENIDQKDITNEPQDILPEEEDIIK